jgi:dolichyl-phosphate-mannose-protein mannosyltransferase
MLQAIRDFRVGRPQIFAGLLLLAFFFQALWVSVHRRLSDLEYEYIASGYLPKAGQGFRVTSPFTATMAALVPRLLSATKNIIPFSMKRALAIPRPWLMRLPFVMFGLWLGGAIWWVARRLFGDGGGYVALALYCFSPAMVMISSNIGPEIILAWSSFGLVYTAIGLAHTVYAPPKKWVPRIVLLGVAIGICLSTALWSFTVILLAFIFMVYLAPDRRKQVFIVLLAAVLIGLAMLALFAWLTGSVGLGSRELLTPKFTLDILRNVGFVFSDSSVFPVLFILTLLVYWSWPRARYFGNTAPLITSFAMVLLFTLIPAIHIWYAPLGLSFAFTFAGGVAADLLETRSSRPVAWFLLASVLLKAVLGLSLLSWWVHQNPL